jgi:predicted permease
VVTEVALACGLLALASLLIKGAVALRAVELPFAAREIFTAQLPLTDNIAPDQLTRDRLLRELKERVETTLREPAAIVSALPGRGAGQWPFVLDGQRVENSRDMPSAGVALVTPGFLDVLSSSPRRGRDIAWTDDADALPVALVNESWIRRFSPDRDPVGRRIRLAGQERDLMIVGVTPDLQVQDVDDSRGEGIYVPMLQHEQFAARLLVRSGGDAIAQRVRDAVESVHPDLPLFEPMTLHEAIYSDKKILDAFSALFLLFGIGALFLTVTGLYGVVAFSVNRRTREVGIRMALGAKAGDVIRMVLREGSRHLVIGLGIGIAIALGIARVMASAIELIDPLDPVALLAVPAILAATGVLALLVPARRAASVTPSVALRRE